MSIRFCEFCSTVHHDETTHCPECGTRLVQTVSEEYFNDPANPWPFVPIDHLHLEIQGKARHVRFSGTHSVFHLWAALHKAYTENRLYCRYKSDELELMCYPAGFKPKSLPLLDPVLIMASKHRAFSLYSYQACDPDLLDMGNVLEMTYHGSFEIVDCPPRFWKDILGWLVATPPHPALDNQWTYFMT